MGYSTDFEGVLKFTNEVTVNQLNYLKTFLGEDCREHPEWAFPNTNLSYIDLKITDDFSGLEWDGSEKTYELEDKVNLVLANMQEKYPEFGLQGELNAQGEEHDDRWILRIVDGKALKIKNPHTGTRVTCPHCDSDFTVE